MTPSCENLCLDVGEPDFRGMKIDILQTLAHSWGLSGIFKRLAISVERMTWQEWARKNIYGRESLALQHKGLFRRMSIKAIVIASARFSPSDKWVVREKWTAHSLIFSAFKETRPELCPLYLVFFV